MIAQPRQYLTAVKKSPALRKRLKPRLTKYIPNRPTKKQRLALCLNHVREIFYGGALGGGKSDWLLMEALQYVDIPDYHALILRKTLADAKKSDSILFRANQWLNPYVRAREVQKAGTTYTFPSGATLEFGGLEKTGDEFKYDGSQFAYIGVDEFTKVNYDQVNYVTSMRLRKPGCSIHKDRRDSDCRYCQRYMHTNLFPLRVRTASNPGGPSHTKVLERYRIKAIPGKKGPEFPSENGPVRYQLYMGTHPERPHIPAFIQDNPFLDAEDYIKQLKMNLTGDPVTLQRYLAGDWGVSPEGRFRVGWLRRYKINGPYIIVNGEPFERSRCYEFVMVDPASSTKDVPGKTELTKKESSWTVVSRWLVTPRNELCLIHIRRFQEEMPLIVSNTKAEMTNGPHPMFCGMELTTQSKHLYQYMVRIGLPMKAFTTGGKDKVARAVDACNRMEQGLLLLPEEGPPWLKDYELEIFTWTGDPLQTDDQVDVTAYAAIHVSQTAVYGDEADPMCV